MIVHIRKEEVLPGQMEEEIQDIVDIYIFKTNSRHQIGYMKSVTNYSLHVLAFPLLAFFLFLLPGVESAAQQRKEKVNELKDNLRSSETDKDRMQNLLSLASNYTNNYQPDSSLLLLQSAKEILDKKDSALIDYYERWMLNEIMRAYMLQKKDSLLKKSIASYLSASQSKQKRVLKAYRVIGYYYKRWYKNHTMGLTLSIPYLDTAVQIAERMKSAGDQVLNQLEIIDAYQELGKLDTAELLIKKLQVFERKHYDSLSGRAYYLRYHSHVQRGQYNAALENLIQSVERIEKYKDEYMLTEVYMSFGFIYNELGRNEESIHWHKKSLALLEEGLNEGGVYLTNNQSMYFMECCDLVEQLIKMKRIREAETIIQKALKNYPPISDIQKARAAQMSAYLYDAMNNKTLAYKHYREMAYYYERFHRMEQPGSYEKSMNDVSDFLIRINKFAEAKTYLSKALAGKYTTPLPIHLSKTYKLLYKVDSAQGNYLASLGNLLHHKRINDSIFNGRKGYQLEELQVKYEVDQKEKDILLLKKQEQIRTGELQQAGIIQKMTVLGIVVLTILLILLFNQFRIKRRSHLQLEAKQKEIAKQNKALNHLVDEKEWLLKEIHHRVKNNLHMITSLLSSQAFQLKDEGAKLAVKDSQNRIQAMSMVHQKLYLNENLSNIDAQSYICDLIDHLKSSFSNDYIQFKTVIEPMRLQAQYAIPVGLIINEAVTNSIKYAFPLKNPGIITIELHREENTMVLHVTDNGVGFSLNETIGRPKSLGMTLINGLTQELGADIQITTDSGTSIILRIPLDGFIPQEIPKTGYEHVTKIDF